MQPLDILLYPDPLLRRRAAAVADVDGEVAALVERMFETMYEAPGIGLAATQVDVHKRLLVTDVSPDRSEPYCLINPEILEREGTVITEEGCLSVPDIFAKVERAERIRVAALDRDGEPFELEAEGLLAVCIQHEMDHLLGKLFVDYLSDLKRQRIRKQLEKARRQREPQRAAGDDHAPIF